MKNETKEQPQIQSVEKGINEGRIVFSAHKDAPDYCKVDEIREEEKYIGQGYYSNLTIVVYRGYKDGKFIFEMGASIDVTVIYKQDEP